MILEHRCGYKAILAKFLGYQMGQTLDNPEIFAFSEQNPREHTAKSRLALLVDKLELPKSALS